MKSGNTVYFTALAWCLPDSHYFVRSVIHVLCGVNNESD